MSLLKLSKNPKHKEYQEMREWLNGDFDPKVFDPSDVHVDNPAVRLKTVLQDA